MVRTLTLDEIAGIEITLAEHAQLSFSLAEEFQQGIEGEA